LYVDVATDTILGVVGETVSYRVEYAEQIFGHLDTHTYWTPYFSYGPEGHMGYTAVVTGDSLIVFDSLKPFLQNPITVGDSTTFDILGHQGVHTVVSVMDTVILGFGRYEDCVRLRYRYTFGGEPEEDGYILYCPCVGEVARWADHWYSYPDSVQHRYSYLIDHNLDCCPITIPGDLNLDGSPTGADVITLVNYVYKGGPYPRPCAAAGDMNCTGDVTGADVIGLVNYVFKAGPTPCDVCTLIPGTWTCP
jgi:hypothetical protein